MGTKVKKEQSRRGDREHLVSLEPPELGTDRELDYVLRSVGLYLKAVDAIPLADVLRSKVVRKADKQSCGHRG